MEWKIVKFSTTLLQILVVTNFTSASPLLEAAVPSNIRTSEINYRLPNNVIPSNYIITLDPLKEADDPETFTGEVKITVKVTEDTNSITLHYNDLSIDSITVTPVIGGTEIPVDYEYESVTHFCVIKINSEDENIIFKASEEYIITINYKGHHRNDMYGFYRSSYKDEDGKTVWLATTQFEPGNARRAFPCFDEPALKATFKISIKKKPGLQAISNMPREDDDDETYYNFEITPVMSTYLIAFIVSDFTVLRNEPENFGVWARKGAIEQAEYSRDVGPKLLHAIEGFLDVKYPLPKLDVVAVPDFSSGAMENWGLTTYRERIVLYDEDHATAATKQQIATVVAHEFAHQWFGDLVSPEWWNYLWLNEGFATYFESFATDLVETEWRLQEQFVVRDLQSALAADALLTTHPITQPVDSPNSIRAIFDTISYEKAGSVIRMMEHFVTTEVFKKGLKRYLVARDHLDANENHLYEAINAELLETKPGSHENVADILHTWTQQAGYPLVTITSEDSGLTITQERFLLTRASTRNEGSTLWSVPLTYAVQDGDFTDTSTKEWLTESSLKIGRPTEEDKWFIFNVQQIGFYRVNYDEHNWNLLTNYLKSEDYEKIPPVNRAQILDDALNLARAGILEYSTALELTQYLEEEVDYIPWYSALNAFSFLNLRLAGTSTHPLFKEYILKLIQHVYEDLTYEESDADDHVTKLLRSSILQWACNLDHEDCVEKAKGKFHALHEGSSIKPNLQSVTYCTALRHGGEEEWNLLWDKYVKSNFATEQSLILGVLGCTAHQELINEYLKKSITDNGDIRRQDAASVFSAVYSNPQGFQFAFDFLRNSYGDIVNFYGTGVASVLTGIAARITTQEQLTEFENFIEHNELGAATEAARRAVESAKENLAWVEKYESEINSWLVSLTTVEPTEPPTASPPTETPTASPPTEPPTEPPPTETPTASPPTEPPTESPPTELPTASPPTETPTASPPTEPPTESPPTEPPTASPPTEPPTAAPPTPTEAATPSTTGEASSVSLSPVLCITLFCTILYQIVTVFKVK